MDCLQLQFLPDPNFENICRAEAAVWLCCGQDVWGMCPIWELEITFESEHKIMMNRAEEELPAAAAAAP